VVIIGVIVVLFLLALLVIISISEKELPLRVEGHEYEAIQPRKNQRFGISAVFSVEGYDLSKLGAGWYINWDYKPFEQTNLEFIPLIAGYVGKHNVSLKYLDNVRKYILENRQNYPDGMIWLIGNEIGYIPQKDSRTPEQYVEDYHKCYEMLKGINSSYKVAVGPIVLSENKQYVKRKYVEGKGGMHYLKRILQTYKNNYGQNIPVDFYTVTSHVFEKHGVDIDIFKEQIINFRKFLAKQGESDKGLIITEFGCALKGASITEIVDFMSDAFIFLSTAKDEKFGCTTDDKRLVQRWGWFTLHSVSRLEKIKLLGGGAFFLNFSQTSLFNKNGDLNCLGKTYANFIRLHSNGK